MKRIDILRAKTLSSKIKVITGRLTPLFFLFEIGETSISLTPKGFKCDYIETDEEYNRRVYLAKSKGKPIPIRWSHSLNKGECNHILACKMYLKERGIKWN